MDNGSKKSDINKRILETRKQTEELREQLQNLIDCGNDFLPVRNKISNHSNLGKENINKSQSRPIIAKSCDAKHSYNKKAGTSKSTLNTKQCDKKAQNTTPRIDSIKRVGNLNSNRTQETRLGQSKLQNIGKTNAQLQKQKLLELDKKSLEIVARNVKAKRERSKSQDRTAGPTHSDQNASTRHRSVSQGGNSVSNGCSHTSEDKTVEKRLETVEQRNPNLLYPPLPDFMTSQQESLSETNKTEDVTEKSNKELSSLDKNSLEKVGNVSNKKSEYRIGVTEKLLKPVNLFNSSHSNSDKSNCNITLRSPKQDNLKPANTNLDDNLASNSSITYQRNDYCKPKSNLSNVAVNKLEKDSKRTQTNDVQREKIIHAYPHNFINTVKRKLQHAVNIPKSSVEVSGSLLKEISQPNTPENIKTKEEIFRILQRSTKSSKKSYLKSFALRQDVNLDPRTLDCPEQNQRDYKSRTVTKLSEMIGEPDVSKNTPEIFSENCTSEKKTESVKQSTPSGIKIISNITLVPHCVKSQIRSGTVESEVQYSSQVQLTSHKSQSRESGDIKNTRDDVKKTSSKNTLTVENQSTLNLSDSDLSRSRESIISFNSPTYNKVIICSSNGNPKDNNLAETNDKPYSKNHSFGSSEDVPCVSGNSVPESSFLRNDNQKTMEKNIETISTRKCEVELASDGRKLTNVNRTCSGNVATGTNMSVASDVDRMSKSESHLPRELQNINTRRGSGKLSKGLPLTELTISQNEANQKAKSKLKRNISLRSDWNLIPEDSHHTNEIHLKFEAEIHLLNDFNESLRQLSAVEGAFKSLGPNNSNSVQQVLQNQHTQTSLGTKSSTSIKENLNSGANSELSSINYSRGPIIDVDLSNLILNNTLSNLENQLPELEISELNKSTSSVVKSRSDLSNIENLHSNNFAGMSLHMFEQLIKDEDVRLENLKTILKIREQALLDRTKAELAWLEIQRKHLGETGRLQEASLVKNKQSAILANLQKEKHEMQRLKQMQNAASLERKIILKEQRSLIKHQLRTDNMVTKIKVNLPRERRLSGPLKVVQSHSDSIRSKTSISLRSSTDKDEGVYNVTSHTHSVVSTVSEVSGDRLRSRDVHLDVSALDLANRSEGYSMPISQMTQTLLLREAVLQKRRRAAEDLLQWHKKLLEEEKRVTELESAASAIISNTSTSVDNRYKIKEKHPNQLWRNLTGCEVEKSVGDNTYPTSQAELEQFRQNAVEYSKTKKVINVGGSKINSEVNTKSRTEANICENIPVDVLRKDIEQSPSMNEVAPTASLKLTPEIVSNDINIVDQNINRLIDDFIKVKEDISSLSNKQSLKARQNQEHDRSEKTASGAQILIIEATKISKQQEETSKSEKVGLRFISEDNINMCNNTAPAVVEIKGNLGKSKAKVTSQKPILSEEPQISSYKMNLSKTDKNILNKTDENILKQAQVEISGDLSENFIKTASEAENDRSINTNQILLELSTAEEKIHTEVNKNSTVEEDQQVESLNKTEEILNRLGQLRDKINKNTSYVQKSSIIRENLLSSVKDNAAKEKDILQTLARSEDKISTDVPSNDISTQKLLIVEENQMSWEDKENVSRTEEVPRAEDRIVSNFSAKPSAPQKVIENLSPVENITAEILPKLDEEDIRISSETPNLSKIFANKLLTLKEYEAILVKSKIEENELQFVINKAKDDLLKLGQEGTISTYVTSSTKDIIALDGKSSEESNHVEKKVSFKSSEKISLESLEETDGIEDLTDEKPISDTDKQAGKSPAVEIIVIDDDKESCAEIIVIEDDDEPHELIDKESEKQSKFVKNSNISVTTGEEYVVHYTEATTDIEYQSIRSVKLKSGISEENLPRNEAEGVKTRVSEILANARQTSLKNKSPRLQHLYTTTYDVVAPITCEELGTPKKEEELITAKSIFGSEAENILKKQLAIEQEIKQITQQQSSCLIVREIPNKPPPPYAPHPSSLPVNVITIVPTILEIQEISKYSAKILHKAYLLHNLDNISISENTLGLISKNIAKECYKFVFDLCKEISQEHYKQFEKEKCPSWLQVAIKPQLTVVKPLDVGGLEKHMIRNLMEFFGYSKIIHQENTVIKWSRKYRDHVDETLVMESQGENARWTNFDKDELLVMNDVTNEILNILLKETGQVFSTVLSKRTYFY